MRNDIHFGENVSDEAKDDSSASFNLNGSRSKENYSLFSLGAGQQFGDENNSLIKVLECNEKLK